MIFYNELLHFLYKNHSSGYIDISEFIFSFFEENDDSYNEISDTLNKLSQDRLINLTAISHKHIGFGKPTGISFAEKEQKLTFSLFREKKWKIEAKIFPNGIDKIKEWEFRKSALEVNSSVKGTNKIQKWSLIITGIAIVITCVFQIRSWYVSNEQLATSISQYKLDSLKHQSDSLTINGLTEKTRSIQKQLDALRKK